MTSTTRKTAARKPDAAARNEVTFVASEGALEAHIPDRGVITLSTDLSFDELMTIGSVALALEGGIEETAAFEALQSGLIPDDVRSQIGPLPARYALRVLTRWLSEALKVLEELGEAEASS